MLPATLVRRRAASAGGRRRPPHPRPAVALSRRRGLSRHHGRDRGRRARQAQRPELRSAHSRRDDAGRNRLRLRQVAARHLERADPDADRARRRRKPHQGPRDGRRRLSVEAVRAARIVAAHRQYPQARAAGGRAAGGIGALRAVRLSSGARRIAPRRGGHPADRPRARDAAHAAGDAGRNGVAPGARRQRRHGQRARRRRAGQPAAPQDRAQSRPIRCSCRPCAASATGWWPRHDQPRHRHPHHPHALSSGWSKPGAGTTRSRRSAASTPCSAASPTAGGGSAAGSTA